MPRGGKREGAGRKVGSKLQKTAAIAHRLAEAGQTPLEYVLSVMWDDSQTTQVRLQCAQVAMPYIHPRVAQVQNLTQNNVQVNQNFQSNGAGSLQAAWERVEREKEERRLLANDAITGTA